MSLLALEQLQVAYGGIRAVKGVDITVEQGEVVCLIGANGAGKTTTLRAITGLVRAAAGRIVYDGATIQGQRVHEIARRGLAMVPEGRGIFAQLTIDENLAMGAYARRDRSAFASDVERAFTLFPRLKERRGQVAGTLSGGEQQMLAMARALMTNPTLLLLDEPLEGLAPIIVDELAASLKKMKDEGTAAILVEQHTDLALSLTDDAVVIERGSIVHRARSADFAQDAATLERYVGLKVS